MSISWSEVKFLTKLYVYDNLILVKNLSTKIEIRALMNTFHKLYIIGKGALHTMDRRQKKTIQAIIDAFVKLLTKTSYEKVSVKDIIDAADVGRSTFYSHFETKDDLARQICFELFDHIFSPVIPPCSTHNFSHILYHLRDKREYYLGIINYDDCTLFLGFFRDYMLQNVSIKMSGSYDEYSQRVPEDFFINSLTSSFVGMIRWWLKNKMNPGPEVVAGYYMALINPAIAEFQTKGE